MFSVVIALKKNARLIFFTGNKNFDSKYAVYIDFINI